MTLITDAATLAAAIETALPSWGNYHHFDGRKNATPLRLDPIGIDSTQVEAALAAVREIPDELAELGFVEPGWRISCADLTSTLRAWGWSAESWAKPGTIAGLWGDTVFPQSFAVVVALLPHLEHGTDSAWVFAAYRDDEPAFGLQISAEGIEFSADVYAATSYEF